MRSVSPETYEQNRCYEQHASHKAQEKAPRERCLGYVTQCTEQELHEFPHKLDSQPAIRIPAITNQTRFRNAFQGTQFRFVKSLKNLSECPPCAVSAWFGSPSGS